MADGEASFTVAIATRGRTAELEALLQSIGNSSSLPAQILIVDQNWDDRLDSIVAGFPSLPIDHHHVSFVGLSAAKNYAARNARGDILFTPDDDCRVMRETFQLALNEFAATGADVVFGKTVDEEGTSSIVPLDTVPGWLTLDKHIGMFVEPATAARTAVAREIPFDETLGVGTFHGAEEGHDWVLRLLKAGKRLYFQPSIEFFHPQTVVDKGSPSALRRVFSYRCGFARLCRKHGLWGKYARRVALTACAIPVYAIVDRTKARYYLAELSGLVAGMVIEA